MSEQEHETTPSRAGARGEEMRNRLLEAAIDVFARHGYDGASTRMLARAAGANLQAIPYYFGGKEGLYLAAADYIAGRIRGHVGPVAARVRARLAAQGGATLPPAEASALLAEMLRTAARLMLSEESAHWARFIVSEQMEPTEAFERIYAGVMSPLLETARGLVGALMGEDAASEIVRLRTLALLGQVLVFRVAHAAVMRQLGWQEIGPREFALIDAMIQRSVGAIGGGSDGAVSP
ncbi:MAG TPA: CerR family C-terminal domain-containing protein [Stellaceae bacterium]|jgi:AcrR family transcriptional regulator|nr:CerR family C-terminal domain-containing protein [Stellaceae bacterium]